MSLSWVVADTRVKSWGGWWCEAKKDDDEDG
jgi:hypothetical protein